MIIFPRTDVESSLRPNHVVVTFPVKRVTNKNIGGFDAAGIALTFGNSRFFAKIGSISIIFVIIMSIRRPPLEIKSRRKLNLSVPRAMPSRITIS